MSDAVLVLNAGSSSIKFSLFAVHERPERWDLLCHGAIDGVGLRAHFTAKDHAGAALTTDPLDEGATHEDALGGLLRWLERRFGEYRLAGAGHRVVHGGLAYLAPVRVDATVVAELRRLVPLAPLHQPHHLAAIEALSKLHPALPQIACFDTAFHARHDPLFALYALPREFADKGVRRYGFHGLSYEWIARVLRRQHPQLAAGRVIAGHLGNGASLCAMRGGKSVDTTMGMTALDGLPMGTRSGALDPGAVIYMVRDLGMPPDEVEHALYEKSGLKGLSGATNDVRALLASDDPRAKFALDYFALKVAQYIAMMAVSIGGIDAVVFTGGIGENAAPVRDTVMGRLAFLGAPQVLVIPADEERMIAMHVMDYLEDNAK